jgi:hypothetical protein
MEDVQGKLNAGLSWQRQHSAEEGFLQQQIGITFEGETNKVLHLEYSFVWC